MHSLRRPWLAGRPSVTAMLVAGSVAAAVMQWLFVVLDEGDVIQQPLLREWLAITGNAANGGRPWQFFTFALLHAGPLHLFGNMAVLLLAGRELEPIIGRRHFFAIYALGNVIGGVAQWAVLAAGFGFSDASFIGVSAGALGVLVAFATVLPELEITLIPFAVRPLRLRARTLGAGAVLGAGALLAVPAAAFLGPVAMLAASFVAWVYVRQLGFGSPFALQRHFSEKRERAARLRRMPAAQFICEEIDPILEKIARDGLRSLTRAERRTLEQGREKMGVVAAPWR